MIKSTTDSVIYLQWSPWPPMLFQLPRDLYKWWPDVYPWHKELQCKNFNLTQIWSHAFKILNWLDEESDKPSFKNKIARVCCNIFGWELMADVFRQPASGHAAVQRPWPGVRTAAHPSTHSPSKCSVLHQLWVPDRVELLLLGTHIFVTGSY